MQSMELAQTIFLPLCLCIMFLIAQQTLLVSAAHKRQKHHPKKLFVFGDSLADTGNSPNDPNAPIHPWEYPFGITFPGKPTGRFSDGRVLTDFVAEFIRLKSPTLYRLRKMGVKKPSKYGMNFAHGGTGVLDGFVAPNMTTQIDFFQQLVDESVFKPKHLRKSVALVVLAGNDYGYYAALHHSYAIPQSFMESVVNQLTMNLKRLYDLGVKKVAVTTLPPMGCSSALTSPLHKTCNEFVNAQASVHNLLLQKAVAKLNKETQNSFIILDLYASFKSVFKNKGDRPGSIKFENPLEPCVLGEPWVVNKTTGVKKYTVCEDPKSTFFWDNAHPTQQGWRAVCLNLQATLRQLYYF